MEFKEKVVIITGASSGIGASAATKFSAAGAKVVIVGRNETKLSAVAARCCSPLVIKADISKDDDARRVIDETIKRHGQIDVLVNNAGMNMENGGLLGQDMMRAYDVIMAINLRAVVFLTHLAAPHLLKTKGNIVNISSGAGVIPPFAPGLESYFTSKAGLNHFTVCAATELGLHGVRVNVISPGPVRTDFLKNANSPSDFEDLKNRTLLKRVSEPEEIADLIYYLASDKAKSITGVNYLADNGIVVAR